MNLSRKQAADLLGISISTLQRRTKAGIYQAMKTGVGQFAEVTYTHAGIGLREPQPEIAVEKPQPASEPAIIPPKPEPSSIDLKSEEDRKFAEAYLAGEATDSSGNRADGTNRRFPSKGMQSLLGPVPKPEPPTPATGTAHMDPALLSDWPDPTGAKPLISPGGPQTAKTGFTRHGVPLAAGYTQEQYDADMRKWQRNGGGRSEGEMEEAIRRSKELILSTFPKADRT